ncbi:NAD(P)-dependent oxidoreductase [Nocardia arthritidis]|uniref:NAD(P)-dependent oxidoreductase n=1 Tax=Nocardia arthritidis TaxID=228602 RepID=A0A6G9YGN4_9NOCA|nr:NAD(P)-binding domain-containing protein [Nocardia arthritidis]QIS12381.1 NAD(P)-dependent oxidoreductase [Nocardia arthritidis]
MPDTTQTSVTVLGLGPMGAAMAAALLKGDRPTTVWNRTQSKADELVAAGATRAATVAEAVRAGDIVFVVLSDHASVTQTLEPVAAELRGRQVVNLTSTTPDESRALAAWAADNGIAYLDGGIMAVPAMIGQPGSTILYSGVTAVFEDNRETLELFGAADYFGTDAGLAAMYDFALLTNMYGMFAGFFQGAAMLRTAGVPITEFAERAVAWVTAMAQLIPGYAATIDSGDYESQIFQPIEFHKPAVDAIVRAGRDAGVRVDIIGQVQNLIDRQIADGDGRKAFEHTIEALA